MPRNAEVTRRALAARTADRAAAERSAAVVKRGLFAALARLFGWA